MSRNANINMQMIFGDCHSKHVISDILYDTEKNSSCVYENLINFDQKH